LRETHNLFKKIIVFGDTLKKLIFKQLENIIFYKICAKRLKVKWRFSIKFRPKLKKNQQNTEKKTKRCFILRMRTAVQNLKYATTLL
jgi:hypothetical protein